MFNVKNAVFLNFTQRQKSMLLSYLKSFVKKFQTLKTSEIIDKFIEDENYYIEINNPHFEFLENYLLDENFLKDLKTYIEAILYDLKQKEMMRPLIEAQKKYQKEQRRRANDYKMSKLEPTKKQLYYYEKVSKAHNIPMKPTEGASRLDLRNWIMEIIEPENEEE